MASKTVANPLAAFTFVEEMPRHLKVAQVQGNTTETRRTKMLAVIKAQKDFWINPKSVERADKRDLRTWHKRDGTDVYISPKYGTRAIELVHGRPVVKVHMEQVESFYDALADAVFRGQLDDQLKELSDRTGAALRAGRKANNKARAYREGSTA